MKRYFALIFCLIFVWGVALAGCGNGGKPADTSLLPKPAADPAVYEELGSYKILASVPVYDAAGLYGGVISQTGDALTLQYMGVSDEAYQAYAERFIETGWKLKEGSKLWLTEGWMGMPQFVKGGILVTIAWSITEGKLNISVAYA